MAISLSSPLPLPRLFLASIILLVLIITPPTAALLASLGSTLALDGIYYYVPATPFANVEHDFSSNVLRGKETAAGLVPVTVISGVGANFSQIELGKTLVGFAADDDVWGTGFLGGESFEGFEVGAVGVMGDLVTYSKSYCRRSLELADH